jgi:hypothetical protein
MKTYCAAGWMLLMMAGPVMGGLRAGAARVVISPPAGAAMAGYYHYRACDGVIDDIHASALVLDDASVRVAMVTLDLIDAPRALVEEVRRGVDAAGLLSGGNVMISATHAHTGPVPGRLLRTPDAPADSADSVHGRYLAGLPGKIVESVREAAGRLAPVVVSVSSGECPDTSFCRRFYLRDGTVAWNPGKLNPAVMLPCGPVDPEVQGVFFEPPHAPGDHAAALAVYANFSMHPDTVGGTKVSADYPGVVAKLLAGYHGKDSVVLYGNGASGNLNHIDVQWARRQSGIEEAHRLGTLVAAALLRADKERRTVADGPLQMKSMRVPLAVSAISPEAAEMARLTVNGKRTPAPGFMDLVRANRLLDLEPLHGEPISAEVQVVTLGREIAWVALPGEVFSELGLALKKRSPFARTLITTLANGSVGYVPDRRSYAEKAYEAESARVEPGSGEQLVESAVQMLGELHESAAR